MAGFFNQKKTPKSKTLLTSKKITIHIIAIVVLLLWFGTKQQYVRDMPVFPLTECATALLSVLDKTIIKKRLDFYF